MMESKSAVGVWCLIFRCTEFTLVYCVYGQAQYVHTHTSKYIAITIHVLCWFLSINDNHLKIWYNLASFHILWGAVIIISFLFLNLFICVYTLINQAPDDNTNPYSSEVCKDSLILNVMGHGYAMNTNTPPQLLNLALITIWEVLSSLSRGTRRP